MERSFIKFSDNGTSFVINLANGSETMDINSKEEGFSAITKFANEKKITPEEFAEMRDQILNAEKLPWNESKGVSISIGIMGGGNFLGEILTLAAMRSMDDIMASPDKPVESAYFEVCESCKKHGRIYTKKCYTGRLDSKKEAIFYLEELKKRKDITEEEFQKVKTEIETSPIPEE